MGEIIQFEEAAARIREQRRSGLGPADWFWLATGAFWPVAVAVFAAMSAAEILARGGRRA